jgi:hypothetical protein
MMTLALILTALFILWILLEIRNAPLLEEDPEEMSWEYIAWARIEYELGEWIAEQDSTPNPKQVLEWLKENYQVPNRK